MSGILIVVAFLCMGRPPGEQGAVGPKETRLRLLLQAEVKLLSDMKAAGDHSKELEADLKAIKFKLRVALRNKHQGV